MLYAIAMGQIISIRHRELNPDTVTHFSTNGTRRSPVGDSTRIMTELWTALCMYGVRSRRRTVYEEPSVAGHIHHHGTNNVAQADRQGVNVLTARLSGRKASRNV